MKQGTETFKAFYADLKDPYKICEIEDKQWCEECRSVRTGTANIARAQTTKCNMATLIYNGIIDQVLKDEYDKLERKDRTIQNMVNMAVRRHLKKMLRHTQAQEVLPFLE